MPSITPSQNTPVLPNMRRKLMRPRGVNCSRRNSEKLSLATMINSRLDADPTPIYVPVSFYLQEGRSRGYGCGSAPGFPCALLPELVVPFVEAVVRAVEAEK